MPDSSLPGITSSSNNNNNNNSNSNNNSTSTDDGRRGSSRNKAMRNNDEEYNLGLSDDADPYSALRVATASPKSRKGKSRKGKKKPSTATYQLSTTSSSLGSAPEHLNFRHLGQKPQMPNTTPSLREQLRLLRMGNSRPLPQVESTKKMQERKRAAHNVDVKARMNLLLAGGQDRGVIQKIRKEHKQVSKQLKQSQDELARAKAEIEALRDQVYHLQEGSGAGDGPAGGSHGNGPSPSNKGTKGSSRPATPATPEMSPRPTIQRRMSSTHTMRRAKTGLKMSRTATTDFAGFRARSTLHRARFTVNQGAQFPQQFFSKFPWNLTDLNLDDKTEDLFVVLQESGTTNSSILALINKLFETIELVASTAANTNDIVALCDTAQTSLVHMTGCEAVNLWLSDIDSGKLICRRDKSSTHFCRVTDGYVGKSFQGRSVVKVSEQLEDKGLFLEQVDSLGIAGTPNNCIVVPVVGNNTEVIGVLQCLNRPHGAYSDIDEAVLRHCGKLLGPIIQACFDKMTKNRDLVAYREITKTTTALYSSLSSISIDVEKPDKLDPQKTLEAVQKQAALFAERLTKQSVTVRVHIAKDYSSMKMAETLASLPVKQIGESNMSLSNSHNGIVGHVFQHNELNFEQSASESPYFNENVDIVSPAGHATYTVPVYIIGHQAPLAVLQVSQASASATEEKQFLLHYERFAAEIAFALLYFVNVDRYQKEAEQARAEASGGSGK